ncbi:Myb protein j [Globisporangium polare]
MTISKRIRSQLFVSSSAAGSTATVLSSAEATATISDAVTEPMLIRLPLHKPVPGARKRPSRAKKHKLPQRGLGWSDEEHERFLRGLEAFPTGPWKAVASFVGTRTTRQVMTHAQKYRQRIERRQRRLTTQTVLVPILAVKATGDGDAMDVPSATTTESAEAQSQVGVKSETVGLFIDHAPSATCELNDSSLLTTSSPSSTDHAMSDLDFYPPTVSDAADNITACHLDERSSCYSSSFLPVLGTTDDEFHLAIDEVSADMPWVNQFGDRNDHATMALILQNDPLALLFQDPSTYSSQHKSAMLWMDVLEYPAASSMRTLGSRSPTGPVEGSIGALIDAPSRGEISWCCSRD